MTSLTFTLPFLTFHVSGKKALLSHKIRVYIPFDTNYDFHALSGVMVNRKQFEYFTIEDNPMRKPNAKLLSDEDQRV